MTQGLPGISTTLIVVISGLLCMGLVKRFLHIDNIPALLVALVIPLFTYALVSGSLVSFTMPGGLGAKFAAASEKRIDPKSMTITAEDATIIEKAGIEHLSEALPVLRGANPIMLTLTAGNTGYNSGMLLTYLNALRALPNFKFLVLLDSDRRLIGYMSASTAIQILSSGPTAELLVDDITGSRLAELTHFPGVVTKSLPNTASNREALQVMAEGNLDAAVVTDTDHRVQGMIERNQVMSTLILAMAQ